MLAAHAGCRQFAADAHCDECPPTRCAAGLLRFLQLLATFPWAVRPLVVDPEGVVTGYQRRSAQDRFDERRRAAAGGGRSPGPRLCLCTPKDLAGMQW